MSVSFNVVRLPARGPFPFHIFVSGTLIKTDVRSAGRMEWPVLPNWNHANLKVDEDGNRSAFVGSYSGFLLTLKTNPCFWRSHTCFGYLSKSGREHNLVTFQDKPIDNYINFKKISSRVLDWYDHRWDIVNTVKTNYCFRYEYKTGGKRNLVIFKDTLLIYSHMYEELSTRPFHWYSCWLVYLLK